MVSTTFLSDSHTQANISSTLNHTRAMYQITRDIPYSPNSAITIQSSQSQTIFSALPSFSLVPVFCHLTKIWSFLVALHGKQ